MSKSKYFIDKDYYLKKYHEFRTEVLCSNDYTHEEKQNAWEHFYMYVYARFKAKDSEEEEFIRGAHDVLAIEVSQRIAAEIMQPLRKLLGV